VNPDLVARDEDGTISTVRYEAINAMLLNEFLKEHREVQALKTTVAQQEKDLGAKIAEQQKQIEALTAGLQASRLVDLCPVSKVEDRAGETPARRTAGTAVLRCLRFQSA